MSELFKSLSPLNHLLFRPPTKTNSSLETHEDLRWIPAEGIYGFHTIPCLFIEPMLQQSNQIILYFHGNGCDLLSIHSSLIRMANHLGRRVVAMEYPYYGLAQPSSWTYTIGQATEKVCNAFAWNTILYVCSDLAVSPEQIILFGYSIGSGVAVELCYRLAQCNQKVAMLLLQSPFTSIKSVVEAHYGPWSRLFHMERFNNAEKIDKLECPILLLHGVQDNVIPFQHSEQLYNRIANAEKKLIYLTSDHTNFNDQELFESILKHINPPMS